MTPAPPSDTATFRDYFAGLAMMAMVGTYRETRKYNDAPGDSEVESVYQSFAHRDLLLDIDGHTGESEGAKEIAGDAYIIADAMLKAREGGSRE